jgi:hypothetical protein
MVSRIKIQFEPQGEHSLVPLEGPIGECYAGK